MIFVAIALFFASIARAYSIEAAREKLVSDLVDRLFDGAFSASLLHHRDLDEISLGHLAIRSWDINRNLLLDHSESNPRRRCIASRRQPQLPTHLRTHERRLRSIRCFGMAGLVSQAAQLCRGAAWALAKVYLTFAGLLVFFQRQLIFMPPSPPADPEVAGGRLIRLKDSNGDDAVAVYFAPKVETAPVVAYFHGNADQIGWGSASLGCIFRGQLGVGFLGVEYPGYGYADGSPSEKSITTTSAQVLSHLTSTDGLNVPPERIILEMAAALYPIVAPLVKFLPFVIFDKFDNNAKAGTVKIPTLVLHGAEDEVVPFEQGRELAGKFSNASFTPIPGAGHNDMFNGVNEKVVMKTIKTFIEGGT